MEMILFMFSHICSAWDGEWPEIEISVDCDVCTLDKTTFCAKKSIIVFQGSGSCKCQR